MKNKLNIVLLILGVLSLSSCANHLMKKANREYEHMHLQKAIKHYNKALTKKTINLATVNLANCYFLTNDMKSAKHYYKDAVYMPESNCGDYINYAKILMQDKEYAEAKKWLKTFLEHHPDDLVAKMLYASCNSISDFYRDTTLFELHQMEVDGFKNAFSPTQLNEGVVFSGDKEVVLDSKTSSWTGNSYLDLYFTEKNEDGTWLDPKLLNGDINGKYHEGPAVFTKDGKKVYFTRNNYIKRKLNDNSPGENNLKLYSAELINNKWTNIKELPFNNDAYSVGHPALSDEENKLFFISDMPGGLGGTDVWMATKNGETWSVPKNLGEPINSPGNEMFPYYHADGSLYFSSDAHHSMGGLDVFITSLVGDKWLEPENLNYPLNSSRDDFGFVLSNDNKTGYVSSSRSEGSDALFEFVKHPPKFNGFGTVYSKLTGKPLADVEVILSDLSGKIIETQTTTSNGRFTFKLQPNSDYKVLVRKEGFFAVSKVLSTVGKKYSENYEVNLQLDELIIEKPIVIDNIYYDYDKWFIRDDAKPELDKLVKIMEDNPKIVVELSSHTDARASDGYNLVLSDKRAYAAVEYIITKGITKDRITAKGYGETKLLNECKNDVECTEEKHQVNRRTEFKVTKLNK